MHVFGGKRIIIIPKKEKKGKKKLCFMNDFSSAIHYTNFNITKDGIRW